MDKENLSAQKDQVGGDHEHHHDHRDRKSVV